MTTLGAPCPSEDVGSVPGCACSPVPPRLAGWVTSACLGRFWGEVCAAGCPLPGVPLSVWLLPPAPRSQSRARCSSSAWPVTLLVCRSLCWQRSRARGRGVMREGSRSALAWLRPPLRRDRWQPSVWRGRMLSSADRSLLKHKTLPRGEPLCGSRSAPFETQRGAGGEAFAGLRGCGRVAAVGG